jgi:tetratricopeptide (TPR) repeat protein
MACTTSICSASPPRTATSYTTCSANTPTLLQWPPILPSLALRLDGCWITTFTPPPPPTGSSPGAARLTSRHRLALQRAGPPLVSQKEAVAWLEAERANIYACADHAALHGLAVHAVWIPAQLGDFLRIHDYLDQALALHEKAADITQAEGDRASQATALSSLGYIRRLLGQHTAAIRSLTLALGLYSDLGDQAGQIDVLNLLARAQTNIDDRPAATASATEALALSRAVGDLCGQANALCMIAGVQQGVGDILGGAAAQHLGDQPGLATEVLV